VPAPTEEPEAMDITTQYYLGNVKEIKYSMDGNFYGNFRIRALPILLPIETYY